MPARIVPTILRATDESYPTLLREIRDPPERLHVLGRIEAGDARAVAIVGSRRASPYGLETAERLGAELARAGVTVVSGLAVGIDAAAHRGALAAGGRTIAVLGSGLGKLFPREHAGLADEIARRGAVVTEFERDVAPLRNHFPRRNRIVSGLSRAVVVVEASDKSGSLITARLAAAQGRDVYAVPGEVCRERTRGTHRLLRQGAPPVETALDVLQGTFGEQLAVDPEGVVSAAEIRGIGEDVRRLLECFDTTTVSVEELIARSGFSASRVLEMLLALELRGLVVRQAGAAYSIRR